MFFLEKCTRNCHCIIENALDVFLLSCFRKAPAWPIFVRPLSGVRMSLQCDEYCVRSSDTSNLPFPIDLLCRLFNSICIIYRMAQTLRPLNLTACIFTYNSLMKIYMIFWLHFGYKLDQYRLNRCSRNRTALKCALVQTFWRCEVYWTIPASFAISW